MPKIIELSLKINVEKVSCPGVWLCQYGQVSMSMFALGSGYQTCFVPPVFPLLFKDAFYFQKKFPATCAVNNIACMLKDETIYCELIQWADDHNTKECFVLAQYLGSLSDVLFPPNVCSLDGVDLLMRRTEIFPGILAPKIEISTKVRIDEVWEQPDRSMATKENGNGFNNLAGFRPRSHSTEATQVGFTLNRRTRLPIAKSRTSVSCSPNRKSRPLPVHNNHNTAVPERTLRNKDKRKTQPDRASKVYACAGADMRISFADLHTAQPHHCNTKVTLKSDFIEQDTAIDEVLTDELKDTAWRKVRPCACEICRRYHEMFHNDV